MSLLPLLTAGRSLSLIKSQPNPYRISSRYRVPRFNERPRLSAAAVPRKAKQESFGPLFQTRPSIWSKTLVPEKEQLTDATPATRAALSAVAATVAPARARVHSKKAKVRREPSLAT